MCRRLTLALCDSKSLAGSDRRIGAPVSRLKIGWKKDERFVRKVHLRAVSMPDTPLASLEADIIICQTNFSVAVRSVYFPVKT